MPTTVKVFAAFKECELPVSLAKDLYQSLSTDIHQAYWSPEAVGLLNENMSNPNYVCLLQKFAIIAKVKTVVLASVPPEGK